MGKSRMMGAGHASSSLYKCEPNLPTGGGTKKQGITSRVGLDNWKNREVQTHSNGLGRFKLHFMNQLGGIEPGHSMFGGRWNRADGLFKQFEQKQLEEKIAQDIQNAVIVPKGRYTSSSCNYRLNFKEEDTEKFVFEPSCSIMRPSIYSVLFNNVLVSVETNIQNNTVTVYKNGLTANKVDIQIDSDAGLAGLYKWSRTSEPIV